jgi:GT2 family glycosyltransferase
VPPSLAELSIVVVTWHSADDLPALLASLADDLAAGAQLVVVENGSGDATPALVAAAVPGATIIVNRENRGFAAAANQGLAASRGTTVLFLNPDTVVHPGALARALAALAADARLGVLGCRTLNADGTPQPTVDRFHSVSGLVIDALREGRGARAVPRGRAPATSGSVDWVYGSFMLCRRSALFAVGGFDVAYEMYGEDLDLCDRVRVAGYRIGYCAEASIVHRGNRSGARRYGERRDVEVLRGTLRFFRRRRGRAAERAFRAVAGTTFVLKALVNGVAALARGGPEAAVRARLYGRMAWLCACGDSVGAGELRARARIGIEVP